MKTILTSAAVVLMAGSMLGAAPHDTSFAKSIETTHGQKAYRSKEVLKADLTVNFGGNTMIDGTMYFDIDSERVRIEQKDGTTMVWDGERAWITPAESEMQGARFHLRTWTYFLAAPFKLNDPGSHMDLAGSLPLMDGKVMETGKLTFGNNVGDSPDDWYIVYRDDKNRMAAMSYIVTYSMSAEEAEAEPHAIVYNEYATVDGVTFSTSWTFHDWANDKGIFGDELGNAKISNISFVRENNDWFTKPANAREDALPGS
ncbi:MAG: hypothetical protein AAF432_14775 [Planctomycetota bacterium]